MSVKTGAGSAATKAAATKVSRGHGPPASCLPLVLGSRVRRDGLLIEAADPKFDLSGDFGAIGRLHVNCGGASEQLPTAGEGQSALTLDIKGRVYDCDILPSNGTICLLAIDGNKAQIETVYDSYLRLSSGSLYPMSFKMIKLFDVLINENIEFSKESNEMIRFHY